MLIVKVYVNKYQIEELEIGRLDNFKSEDGIHKYAIFYKKKDTGLRLKHRYSDAAFVLIEKSLKKFNKWFKENNMEIEDTQGTYRKQ